MWTTGLVAMVAMLALPVLAADHGVTFTPIGFIEDPGPWPASLVFDMTDDGSMLVTSPSAWGGFCTLTDMEGNWTTVGSVAGRCSISGDGSTVVSSMYSPEGYGHTAIWGGAPNVWDPIPLPDGFEPCGSSGLSFFGMGGNADFLTGLTWQGCSHARAYRYDGFSNKTVEIGSVIDGSGRGNDITADGSTVVGWGVMPRGSWRGAEWVNGEWSWIDGLGDDLEFQVCSGSGLGCAWDGDCVAGENCVPNPVSEHWKGEAAAITPDGQYAVGYNYGNSPYHWSDPLYDPTLWGSAWLRGPNGDFTQIGPPPTGSPYDSWTPIAMSHDGDVVVGRYGWWIFSFPVIWTKWTGTMDFQFFLIQQGLDDLWFWYLTDLTSVSADGMKVAGMGGNPEWWTEGFVVDLSRVKVCWAPPYDPDNPRTITVALKNGPSGKMDLEQVLLGGGTLGTCEFQDAAARSRLEDMRPKRQTGPSPDLDGSFRSREDIERMQQAWGGPSRYATPEPQQTSPASDIDDKPAVRELRKAPRVMRDR